MEINNTKQILKRKPQTTFTFISARRKSSFFTEENNLFDYAKLSAQLKFLVLILRLSQEKWVNIIIQHLATKTYGQKFPNLN